MWSVSQRRGQCHTKPEFTFLSSLPQILRLTLTSSDSPPPCTREALVGGALMTSRYLRIDLLRHIGTVFERIHLVTKVILVESVQYDDSKRLPLVPKARTRDILQPVIMIAHVQTASLFCFRPGTKHTVRTSAGECLNQLTPEFLVSSQHFATSFSRALRTQLKS